MGLAGIDDFVRASCGVLMASLLGMTVRMVFRCRRPPVSLFCIYALTAVVLATGSRASYQILAHPVAWRRRGMRRSSTARTERRDALESWWRPGRHHCVRWRSSRR